MVLFVFGAEGDGHGLFCRRCPSSSKVFCTHVYDVSDLFFFFVLCMRTHVSVFFSLPLPSGQVGRSNSCLQLLVQYKLTLFGSPKISHNI